MITILYFNKRVNLIIKLFFSLLNAKLRENTKIKLKLLVHKNGNANFCFLKFFLGRNKSRIIR